MKCQDCVNELSGDRVDNLISRAFDYYFPMLCNSCEDKRKPPRFQQLG